LTSPDQPFYRALLYLRAAGHDTGADTRERLQRLFRTQLDEHPELSTAYLLEKMPQWFDLSRPGPDRRLPPVTRSSIGYANE
jgi:hypothetical protein